MTVKEFKLLVADIPESQDDWTVILSKDMEGNGFLQLNDVSHDIDSECSQYFNKKCNEMLFFDETFDDFSKFQAEVKNYPDFKPCIVLWP